MTMRNFILLSHVHIRENEKYKCEILDTSIGHYRYNNPNSYIMLTGHGLAPNERTLKLCDAYYWQEEIDEKEIGTGHPKLVNVGINFAFENRFEYIFKCRADSIILIPDIADHCLEILRSEKRPILISKGTAFRDFWFGDLFMFAESKLMKDIWRMDNWEFATNGLENLGRNLIRMHTGSDPGEWSNYIAADNNKWESFLRSRASYRDPSTVKWVDLQGPHPHNSKKWEEIKKRFSSDILYANAFDYKPYIWAEDWNYTGPGYFIDEKIFYGSTHQ